MAVGASYVNAMEAAVKAANKAAGIVVERSTSCIATNGLK